MHGVRDPRGRDAVAGMSRACPPAPCPPPSVAWLRLGLVVHSLQQRSIKFCIIHTVHDNDDVTVLAQNLISEISGRDYPD